MVPDVQSVMHVLLSSAQTWTMSDQLKDIDGAECYELETVFGSGDFISLSILMQDCFPMESEEQENSLNHICSEEIQDHPVTVQVYFEKKSKTPVKAVLHMQDLMEAALAREIGLEEGTEPVVLMPMEITYSRFHIGALDEISVPGAVKAAEEYPDVESIVSSMLDNLSGITSGTGVMTTNMDVNLTAEGESERIQYEIIMDFQENLQDVPMTYSEMVTKMSMYGTEYTEESEVYTRYQDGMVNTFTCMEGEWIESSQAMPEYESMTCGRIASVKDWKLLAAKQDVNGQDCYVLTGTLSGADAAQQVREMLGDLGIDGVESMEFPFICYVSRDTNELIGYTMDGKQFLALMLSDEDMEVDESTSSFTIAMENLVYNTNPVIVIPEEAWLTGQGTETDLPEGGQNSYTLTSEDSKDRITISFGDQYEIDSESGDTLRIVDSANDNLASFVLWEKQLFTEADVSDKVESNSTYWKDDENVTGFTVSERQEGILNDQAEVYYYVSEYNFAGTPAVTYDGYAIFDDSYLMFSLDLTANGNEDAELNALLGSIVVNQ